jgi:hypothetical protein
MIVQQAALARKIESLANMSGKEDLIVEAVFAHRSEKIEILRQLNLEVEVEDDNILIIRPVRIFADQPFVVGFSDADDPTSASMVIAGAIVGFSSIGYCFPSIHKKIIARQKANAKALRSK